MPYYKHINFMRKLIENMNMNNNQISINIIFLWFPYVYIYICSKYFMILVCMYYLIHLKFLYQDIIFISYILQELSFKSNIYIFIVLYFSSNIRILLRACACVYLCKYRNQLIKIEPQQTDSSRVFEKRRIAMTSIWDCCIDRDA